MRIGVDCRMFSSKFTGIGRYTYELVDHLLEMNHKLKEPHEVVLFFNKDEHKSFRTVFPVKKVLVDAKHYSWREQTVFLKKLKQAQCDVVHFPHFNVPLFYGGKFTVTIHDLTLSMFPGKKLTKWYHRLAYHLIINRAVRKAKKVIAVSENTKSDIVKHLKIEAEKIEVIYNGVNSDFKVLEDQKKIGKTLKKYGVEGDFLLYTGVWRNHKNLPRLLDALKMMRDEGASLQLVMTGKADSHYPEVKEKIEELELGEVVKLTGLVSEKELIEFYNAARIFVFPSLYEGFGLPPLEAMSCGTPVACSNSSCLPEVCGEGNAVFFDPENTQDMADSILSLYQNLDLQEQLVDNGRERAESFSWAEMARDTFKIIEDV